jgi:hypothetical protein
MTRLPFAGNFWELVVYQRARQLSRDVFEMTKDFPHLLRENGIEYFITHSAA